LRFGRSLYVIVTSIVACIMFTGNLAKAQDSGTEEGWCFAGYAQRMPVALVCWVVVAMGVILLGWYWLRLNRAITSIARLIKDDKANAIGNGKGFLAPLGMAKIDELCKAFHKHFDDCSVRFAEYEKQIKDLQIQIQLSLRREKNAEAIIYSIRDAVIVFDEYDRLLMANEAAGRLFV